MVHSSVIASVVAATLLAGPATAAGLYNKNSPVLQVNARNYDRLIAKSNHTSIVEFYAPWCGHCKNLQPAFEKAAKNLVGLAKVAAVNCDEDVNKQFCGSMGVKGFPTLKIVKPGRKSGTPMVEDYNGPREAKGIVDAVVMKIPNHVKKVTDKDLDSFLSDTQSPTKALLFTEKGTVSALLKAVAVDFLGNIQVGQIRNKDVQAVERFGITQFPTLIVVPEGKTEPLIYEGEFKKAAVVDFLAQIHPPNPDPAPAKVKMPKQKDNKKDTKAAKKAKADFESASKSHASSEGPAAAASATAETLEDFANPTESPSPEIGTAEKPIVLEEKAPPVTAEDLVRKCLEPQSGTCLLAFVSTQKDLSGSHALSSLNEISAKHANAKRNIFPFFIVPDDSGASGEIKKALGLSGDVEIIAINRKRGWWRSFEGADMSREAIESWIDTVKMGEGAKRQLPGILLSKTPESEAQKPVPPEPEAAPEVVPVATKEAEPETATAGSVPEPTPIVADLTTEADPESASATAEPEAESTPSVAEPTTDAGPHDEL